MSFDYKKKYYKLMNDELNHHGFQFSLGLNEDTQEFVTDENYDCSLGGGIYFCDIKHILSYFGDVYTKVYEVSVPDDANIVKCNDKFRANKIILERYIGEMSSVETVSFLLDSGGDKRLFTVFHSLLWAGHCGHLNILKHLHCKYPTIKGLYATKIVEWAHANNHMDIVNYYKDARCDHFMSSEV